MTDAPDISAEPAKEAEQSVEPQAAEPAQPKEPDTEPRRRRWRERQSVHALRREAMDALPAWREWDRRENDETRLPDGERVHVGGIVLAEAFTPSTVSALRKAIEDMPWSRKTREEWLERLAKGRSAAGAGGWVSTGIIRDNNSPFGDNVPALPDGIDAVWLYLFFPTPSLTVIVATFALTEEAGDLSDCLRADYQTESTDFRLQVPGRFGRVRGRIPWARPAEYRASSATLEAVERKRLACESLMMAREADCGAWMAKSFPGRFSTDGQIARPMLRLLLTNESVPFSSHRGWMQPAGVSFGPDVWRSTDPPTWFLKTSDWPRGRRFIITAAARRKDVARDHVPDASRDTNWTLTYDFAFRQSPLVAKWAISCLLSLYSDLLAELRDRAGKRRRGPVLQARDLNRYLIGDGLDASTVVSELDGLTEDLADFRRHLPEYCEYLDGYPDQVRELQPLDLVPDLREGMRARAARLGQDTAATTANIRASAELRQAMANTRLQRVILCLTFLAATVAVISLVVALHPGGRSAAPVAPSHHHKVPPGRHRPASRS